jgi:hypothetical protein
VRAGTGFEPGNGKHSQILGGQKGKLLDRPQNIGSISYAPAKYPKYLDFWGSKKEVSAKSIFTEHIFKRRKGTLNRGHSFFRPISCFNSKIEQFNLFAMLQLLSVLTED